MMRFVRRTVVAVVTLAACDGSPVDPGGPAVLDGYVMSSATWSGLNGAVISVGRRTTTAVGGTFRISDLPVGPIEVGVTRAGYDPLTTTVNLVAGSNRFDFTLALSDVQAAVTSVSLSGVATKMSVPGVMRFSASFNIGDALLQDTITPAVETTGPFVASWTSGIDYRHRYVTVTPTGPGTGTVTLRVRTLTSSVALEAVAVAAKSVDFTHANGCILALDGSAWCWGGNYTGQIGSPTMFECNGGACQYGGNSGNETPLAVSPHKPFVQIMTHGYECANLMGSAQDCGQSCGLTAGGEMWCWGLVPAQVPGMVLKSMALGSAPSIKYPTATIIRVCGLGLESKAYCRIAGSQTEVGAGMTFKSYAIGAAHDCGVSDAGDVFCWGTNREGELGLGALDSTLHSSPVKIASGAKFSAVDLGPYSSCALDTTGRIQCWGMSYTGFSSTCSTNPCQPTPTPLPDSRTYVSFSHNLGRVCGLAIDGSADCWFGFSGTRKPAPAGVPPLVSISVGTGGSSLGGNLPYYACGVGVDQTVYCWNDTTSYRIGR